MKLKFPAFCLFLICSSLFLQASSLAHTCFCSHSVFLFSTTSPWIPVLSPACCFGFQLFLCLWLPLVFLYPPTSRTFYSPPFFPILTSCKLCISSCSHLYTSLLIHLPPLYTISSLSSHLLLSALAWKPPPPPPPLILLLWKCFVLICSQMV